MTERIQFEIKGKSYVTESIRVGHYIDLWKMRSLLSNGTYGTLFRAALNAADEALLMIDIEAFFTVMCPSVLEDMKPGSIRDMGISDFVELKEVYIKSILPSLREIEDLVNGIEKKK